MDNMTHNSSSSSSWDLDMSLGSHHHPLLFDHPAVPPPPAPPPPPLPFHLHHPPPPPHHHHHHHHLAIDPSPSSSLFPLPLPVPPPHHHHHHHHLLLDLESQSHHHRHNLHDYQQQQQQHREIEGDHEEEEEEEMRQQHQQQQGEEAVAEEELGAMKEMMYRIAAMQPVDIDPATIKKPRRRNVRISEDPQSVAARHRRERISERIRILQRLVPGGTKMDTASMLDEAIRYIKFLKRQVQDLQHHPSPGHYPAAGVGPSTTTTSPAARPPSFMPLGAAAGPLIDWAGLTRPVDIHGPTSSSSSSSMGAALGFGFGGSGGGGQSSHGMH